MGLGSVSVWKFKIICQVVTEVALCFDIESFLWDAGDWFRMLKFNEDSR